MTASRFAHKKTVVRNPGPGARVSAQRHQARVHVRVNRVDAQCSFRQKRCRQKSFLVRSFLQTWPKKKWGGLCKAYSERVIICCCFLVPVPSLALRIGSNEQCDGNQCCPSFGGSLRKHHQEWSLRLNLPQHWNTHQVLTHSKN